MTTLDTGQKIAPRASFFNDPVIRGYIYQAVVAALVIAFFLWIINNTAANLAAQNKTTGFDFLWRTAGFDISFSPLWPWSRASYYWEAFIVGILNTLLVAFIGIIFATMLGFTIGIARLSSNFLIARLATVYIETIRNIPLLLQLFFWYFAVLKAMPAVRQSIELPFNSFINQRGIMVPRPMPDQEFTLVMVAIGICIVVAIGLGIWATRTRTKTGRYPASLVMAGKAADALVTFLVAFFAILLVMEILALIGLPPLVAGVPALCIAVLSVTRLAPVSRGLLTFAVAFVVIEALLGFMFPWPSLVIGLLSAAIALVMGGIAYSGALTRPASEARFPVALLIFVVVGVPALIYWATGATLAFEVPVLERFNFQGGLQLPPEFVALVFGLTIYTAAFIAETVRGGIQSVNRGQTEAAQSLGLKDGDRLRLVIIPQAMRVIVPPLTSQYLNLTKNSSLGAAIGYGELFNVFGGTTLNQTGRAIECIAMVMLVYLTFSLITSAIMNWYNGRVRLVER